MKGCIILQNTFANLGHALAIELKEKGVVQDFCGYVYSRYAWNFINNQRDLKYTSLLLDQELYKQAKNEKLDLEYIKKLENDYGIPNLWSFIDIDKKLMMSIPPKQYSGRVFDPSLSHEEMLKVLQTEAKAIISMLEKEKPDFILFFNIGAMAHLILYYAAKKMGIKVFAIDLTRIGNKIAFTEDYRTLTGVEKIFEKLRKGQIKSARKKEAEIILEKFRKTDSLDLPYTMDKANYLKSFSPTRSLCFFTKMLFNYLRNPYKDDYSIEDPWNFLKNRLVRKFRKLKNLSFSYNESDWNEDYAFFPLHFEPETAMSLMAEFYRDQIALIRQISLSLPVHFKLYVKEHPAMVNYRPTSYYRELKRIPNVKLINPNIKSTELIKNAKLVTVITSTAGWEAVMLKKPVISFGDVFYNKLSFVKKCKEIANLPFIVKEQLENFKYNEEEMIDLISAVLEDSIDVRYHQLGGQPEVKNAIYDIKAIRAREDFKQLTHFLAKKIHYSFFGQ